MPAIEGSTATSKRAGGAAGRDFEALKARRMKAAEMFARGRRQVDVVTELGVSAQTASRWHRAWDQGGRATLAGAGRAGRAGRTPRLTEEQLTEVEAALTKGPAAHGFATQMWTLARVAEVIEAVTGVGHGPSQTWTVLRQRLGWSRQRPARRAVERDEAGIATWAKEDRPRINKARGAGGPGSSSKTRAGSPCCRR